MDSRSTRYRSLDAKGAEPPPKTRERHNSAPTVDRRKEQHQRRPSAVTKHPDSSHRSTKSHGRVESLTAPDRRTNTRHSDRHQGPERTLEAKLSAKTSDFESSSSVNLLVLGSRNSGKSTFIRNAVGSQRSRTSTQVVIKDKYYRVQLIELLFDDVDFSSERRIEWPAYVNGVPLSEVDGVFCLYDVADKESVADVPAALTSMTNTGVPCMLVAAKCDVNEKARQVSARFHEQVRRTLAKVAIAEVSSNSSENTKQCFLAMVHRVIASPRASIRASKSSYSSMESSSSHRVISREPSPRASRSRSRSNQRLQVSKSKELLLNLSVRQTLVESENEESGSSASEDEATPPPRTPLRLDTAAASHQQRRHGGPQTPVSSGDYTNKLISPDTTMTAVPETPDSYYVKSMLRPDSASTVDSRVNQTFLDMDDDSHNLSPKTEMETLGPLLNGLKMGQDTKSEPGVPFQELVDKLLLLPASKTDSKFVPSFLCLYRSFATPLRLLTAIIDQFMKVESSKMVHFTKVAEMLRYLQVLAQWTATYPGDFAPGPARDFAIPFVQSIEKSKVFAPAAREISNNLDTIVPDEDLDWAFDDSPSPLSKRSGTGSHPNTSSSSSSLPQLSTEKARASNHKARHEADDSDDEDSANSSGRGSNTPSMSSSMVRPNNTSSQSYANYMQLESAKMEAERFKPIPRIRLSKLQWHQYMETPIDEMAREITRIDWTMYSAIRPRDFVRHVSLSTSQRRQSRAVDNIGAMVKNFNHLALFVSGMILFRDKPKHRARALEKFMALAWKVRQLNNYNSLGAIVAGITGHEIARLTATRDLTPPEVQKQFLRLTILMGISRSHAAYRMAWDNSPGERIPFLPLVRQDLTMAASANQTFIGTNINWKKFEIMGDVIVGIQRSQENPYNFPPRSVRSDEITKLILETKILEESEDSADPRSELYDRSVQIEPQQTGADPRKKFDWLRR
ncbi:RasGEF domain containing protein [Cladophialophora carrionii]|uniref:RasGEF domain containing protein n=1 Tax=Cladophialophora carrionii TaxID=86049 RepID=A0A1C1CJD4_9EURO|nr:RasGEF domain containing protein [Cladophialophora carrionii]